MGTIESVEYNTKIQGLARNCIKRYAASKKKIENTNLKSLGIEMITPINEGGFFPVERMY